MKPIIAVTLLGALAIALPVDAAGQPESMVYKTTADGIEISADIYRADPADGPRPVIVWIHGGALMMNNRKGVPPQLIGLAKNENLVLISLDYRLAPGAMIDEIVADVKDGIAWVRENGPEQFGIDADNLLVAGASAGGYLTLMCGMMLDPPPRALVSYWGYGDIDGEWCNEAREDWGGGDTGPTEEEILEEIGDEVVTGVTKETGAARAKYFFYLKQNGGWGKMVSGFDPKTEREKMAPFCPIQHITAAFPPILMLHGTEDRDVPYQCSVDLAAALTKAGVAHELITVEGGGHGLWGGDKADVEAAFQRSLEYIREQLGSKGE